MTATAWQILGYIAGAVCVILMVGFFSYTLRDFFPEHFNSPPRKPKDKE